MTPDPSRSMDRTRLILRGFLWLPVPLLAGLGTLFGAGGLPLWQIALVLAALAGLDLRLAPRRAPVTLALALMSQPALLLAAFEGHRWQVDIHMYFFAVLALLTLLTSIPAILAGAALVAVHHLALNMAMPGLLYPGGSDLPRTLVHAAILGVETAGLIWMIAQRHAQLRLVEQARRQSEACSARAEAASAAAERSLATLDRIVAMAPHR